MARHNRDARGVDQRNAEYDISYQPDWLHQIKVTRALESGRQSTKTLLRNPSGRQQGPGPKVRTRITSRDRKIDFEIMIDDPRGIVSRIVVETILPNVDAADGEVISFIIDDQLADAPDANGASG
jgi:hypothetical protein